MTDTSNFCSGVSLEEPGLLAGFVYDRAAPGKTWSVGLVHNGSLMGTFFADAKTPEELQKDDIPDQCGFVFNLNKAVFRDGDVIELKILNTDHVVAKIDMKDQKAWRQTNEDKVLGEVRHVHGLTLSGLIDDNVTELPSYEIIALDGDQIVGRTRLYRWSHVGNPKNVYGRRAGFELLIDPALADGIPRRLRVETSTGQKIAGSPVDFCAYPNIFREALQAVPGRPKSRMAEDALNRLLENTIPLSAYTELYDDTALAPATTAPAGYKVLSSCNAKLTQAATNALSDASAPVVYFDLQIMTSDGPYPLLLSGYDHERQLEQGYMALLFAVRDDVFDAARAAGARHAADVALFVACHVNGDEILHCPVPGGIVEEADIKGLHQSHMDALSWQGVSAQAGSSDSVFPVARIQRPVTDRAVSVVIPTKNQGQLLWDCVTSLKAQNAGYDLDITVIDNGTTEDETKEILNRLEDDGTRILEFDEGFNFALINNLAVEHALHEQLCFLNNDVFFPREGALDEICSRLADPTIAAVGPMMVRASDIIQHGGVVLGPHFGATHAFEDRMRHDAGYGELLRVAHECSAVTGALLMTRKSLFEELGGFDDRLFPVNFNDVDYCLRLREAGHRVVFTPHTYIQHFESVSRGRENRSPSVNRMLREVQNLRERWGTTIRNDPFFHPLFSIDTLPYRGLKSRITHSEPRTRQIARQATVPTWI